MEQYLTWSQTEAQHAGNTFLLEPQDAGSNPDGAAGAVTFQIYSPTAPVICIITILLYNTNVEVVPWYLLSSPKPEMQGSIPCFHFFLTRQFFSQSHMHTAGR